MTPRLRLAATLLAALAASASPAVCQPAPAHSALVVLLDASGSMKKSDPNCVRGDAGQLVLARVRDGDLISVAEFGDAVKPLTTRFVTVTAESRAALSNALRSCRATDAHTDIAGALDYAIALEQGMTDPQQKAFPVHVLLLTDGRHEPISMVADPTADVEARLNVLRRDRITVHGLGLGSGVDRSLLGLIGRHTGGHVAYAETPKDLVVGFLEFSRLLGRRWLVQDQRVGSEATTTIPMPAWVKQWQAVFVPGDAGLDHDSPRGDRAGWPDVSSGHYSLGDVHRLWHPEIRLP